MKIEKFSNVKSETPNKEALPILNKIHSAINETSKYYHEREEIIPLLWYSLLAKNHILFLGKPGIAKSALAETLNQFIGGINYFQIQLKDTSPPEDLIGPLKLHLLKDGIMQHNIERKLPEAHIAFVDETFRGGPGVNNCQLGIMNERTFYDGRELIDVPLLTYIGATNSIPDIDSDFMAVYDRYLLKIEIQPIQDPDNLKRMIQGKDKFTADRILTLSEIQNLQKLVEKVTFSDEALYKYLEIIALMKSKNYYISDRKIKATKKVIQATALLRGSMTVEIIDLEIVKHVFWETPESFKAIEGMVTKLVNSDKHEVEVWCDQVDEMISKIMKTDDQKKFQEYSDAKEKIIDLQQRITEKSKKAKNEKNNKFATFVFSKEKEMAQKVAKMYDFVTDGLIK